jgi:hypothetical protein
MSRGVEAEEMPAEEMPAEEELDEYDLSEILRQLDEEEMDDEMYEEMSSAEVDAEAEEDLTMMEEEVDIDALLEELMGDESMDYDDLDRSNDEAYEKAFSSMDEAKKIVKENETLKAELEEAQAKTDEQLKEGYRHYKAADFKRMIAWIDNLLAAIEQYRGVKKATKKARVKKAPSKEKLISKLKYAKDDKLLKLVSINPADIIGAAELWIYNSKSRKLGKYVAAPYKTLGIKGTSIEGFDTDKSVCKTLRKPEEKLKEFNKAGKVQLRKFLEDIKATETKMNGRINADIVLLRVA